MDIPDERITHSPLVAWTELGYDKICHHLFPSIHKFSAGHPRPPQSDQLDDDRDRAGADWT
jgi:hypothetical protein